ncbi:hypothetical protein KBB17_03225 [Candidatus Saccharibacteria bacterium]|jgi:hypothetical protein|nr:hypothetical protein [Candidatus Saccharibacteria bacterium]MBP9132045.1 hypothetical protein [Candidatus Saccharibacteria bacterium]
MFNAFYTYVLNLYSNDQASAGDKAADDAINDSEQEDSYDEDQQTELYPGQSEEMDEWRKRYPEEAAYQEAKETWRTDEVIGLIPDEISLNYKSDPWLLAGAYIERMQETALDEEDLDALADWSHQANLYASAENGFDDDLETRHMLEYADKESAFLKREYQFVAA